jgi:hypothetical protein
MLDSGVLERKSWVLYRNTGVLNINSGTLLRKYWGLYRVAGISGFAYLGGNSGTDYGLLERLAQKLAGFAQRRVISAWQLTRKLHFIKSLSSY